MQERFDALVLARRHENASQSLNLVFTDPKLLKTISRRTGAGLPADLTDDEPEVSTQNALLNIHLWGKPVKTGSNLLSSLSRLSADSIKERFAALLNRLLKTRLATWFAFLRRQFLQLLVQFLETLGEVGEKRGDLILAGPHFGHSSQYLF